MPDESYIQVSLLDLRLDPENPRLSHDGDWTSVSDGSLLREFALKYNLIELARSIADKGFTPRHAEALLVVEDPPDSRRYVVVEGNRRLATLKLLSDPDLRRDVGATSAEWSELSESATGHDLDSVPVVVYPNRAGLDDYLGFRHITGPRPWRPEAKARFIAKLLSLGETIPDVGETHRQQHENRPPICRGSRCLRPSLGHGVRLEETEAGFGVFYNALDQEGVRNHLGLGPQREITSLPESPVPSNRIGALEEVIGFLFGNPEKGIARVIRESRDLAKLGQVLASDDACANLRVERDLERSYRVSGGGRSDLLGSLIEIHSKLAWVNGQSQEYSEDEDIRRQVHRVFNLATDTATRYKAI